jgi:hypothetical protein
MSAEEPKAETKSATPQEILAASVGVGSNAYRLLILSHILILPFFAYWYEFHSLNIFRTWTIFEYFFLVCIAPSCTAIVKNWNDAFFKVTDSKPWFWYSPILYIMIIPPYMKLEETLHKASPTWAEPWAVIGNLSFWEQVLKCDLWWGLLTSPLWILYLVGKHTARATYKETVTTENKTELDQIVLKNS